VLISYKNGQTSVVLRVKLRDSSVSTGAGKTGLTGSSSGLIISTIADNEATATTYTQAATHIQTISTLGTFAAPSASNCRFGEVDSTNHPGVYELQIADARFAVSSAKSLLISISGVTNLAQTDVCVPLRSVDPYDGVHGGMSALPNTACTTNASLLTSGTSTDQLSVSSGLIKVQQGTSAGQLDTTSGQVKVQAGTGNGQIDLVGGIPGGLRTATAAGGSASTITLDGAASSSNSFYNDCLVQITGGTGGSQTRLITGYVGSTQVATVTPNWVTNPDSSSVFVIMPAGRANVAAWLGTAVTAATAGVPDVNAKNINNVAATSVTTINANLGQTQPVNFTGTGGSALIKSDMQDIAGSAVSASTAQLGVNVVNIAGQAAALDGNNLLKVDVEDIKGTASTGAAGYIGPDWGHINAPTTTVDLSNTTIKNLDGNTVQTGDAYARLGAPAGASVSADIASVKSDTGTTLTDVNSGAGAIYSRLGAPVGASISADIAAASAKLPSSLTGGGNIKADAVAIGGDTSCPAHLVALGLSYVIGSVNDSSPTTGGFVGSSGLSTTVGDYNRAFLVFTSGVNQGLGRAISGYTGSTTKTFSFTGGTGSSDAPFPVAPANSDSFLIIGRAANGT
jgi:hypothetical protein